MSNFDLIQNHSNTENCQQYSSIEPRDDRYVSQDHTHFHLCILLRHLVKDLDMLCTQVYIYSNAYENFKNKIYFFIIHKVKVFFYILQHSKTTQITYQPGLLTQMESEAHFWSSGLEHSSISVWHWAPSKP